MEIAQLLDPKLVRFEMESQEKWGAINELIDLLAAEKRVESRSKMLEAVRQREAEVSTGVGFGIAIPHGISDTVIQPSIAFGRSLKGIEYDSIDQKPVTLIFLLAIPKTKYDQDYLRTLAGLARMLVHKPVIEKLFTASTFEDVLEVFQSEKQR